ncbi:unnamed protein product, partial [Prorocentrum cordatum]
AAGGQLGRQEAEGRLRLQRPGGLLQRPARAGARASRTTASTCSSSAAGSTPGKPCSRSFSPRTAATRTPTPSASTRATTSRSTARPCTPRWTCSRSCCTSHCSPRTAPRASWRPSSPSSRRRSIRTARGRRRSSPPWPGATTPGRCSAGATCRASGTSRPARASACTRSCGPSTRSTTSPAACGCASSRRAWTPCRRPSCRASQTLTVAACPGVGDLDFAACGLPLAPGQLPRLLRVRPIRDTHSLTLTWQLPPSLAHYSSKPAGYSTHCLGDEGRGSVLSFLKDEGLATELSAGSGGDNFSNSSNSEVFNVEIALTELGMQQWPAVASVVFQYLKMLRDYGERLPDWPHEEQKLVAQMSFRFLQEKDPCDLVQELSERMLPLYRHRPEHLLVGPWLHEGFEVALIRSILGQLTVRQCFVMLLSSSFGRTSAEGGSEDGEAGGGAGAGADAKRQRVDTPDALPVARRLDPLFDAAAAAGDMKVEPRFGTEYWDCELDGGVLREWEDAAPSSRLHVPRPSEFIATDFQILPRDDTGESACAPLLQRAPATEGFPVPSERLLPEPQRLWPGADRAPLEAWHLNCAAQFNQPRSEVWLKVTCPHYAFDPKNARKEVLMQLYVCCLRDSLNETTYPASQARLHCSVNGASHGLTIYAGGFSQKLLKLVERVLVDLPLEDYFERGLRRLGAQKEQLLRDYKNSWLKPTSHCSALRRLLLMPSCIRPERLERELASSTVQELREFTAGLLAKTGCTLLAAGNTPRGELQSWAEACVSQRLRPEAQPLVELDVVQLERGKTVVLLETALDATQKNSALEVYWQLPGRDGLHWDEGRSKLRAVLELLEEVMSEPLFDSLRTKQQLGYSVSCMQRDSDGVLGFTVTILSAVKRPPVLLDRVEDFLDEFSKKLQDIPAEKFAAHIVALGSRWMEPKRTLSEVQSACWSEVTCGSPVFDRTERDTAVLGTVTREDVADFFAQRPRCAPPRPGAGRPSSCAARRSCTPGPGCTRRAAESPRP